MYLALRQAPINRVGSVMRAGDAASNNPFKVAAHLIKTEGVRRLWVSNATVCLQVGPEMAANFFLYDRLKHALLADPNAPTRAEKFFVGGTAGWLAYSLTFPLLVAQFRLAVVPKGTYSGIIDLVRKTLKMEGLAGFFRGYTTASIRIFGIRGFDMVAFLALKNHFVQPVRICLGMYFYWPDRMGGTLRLCNWLRTILFSHHAYARACHCNCICTRASPLPSLSACCLARQLLPSVRLSHRLFTLFSLGRPFKVLPRYGNTAIVQHALQVPLQTIFIRF